MLAKAIAILLISACAASASAEVTHSGGPEFIASHRVFSNDWGHYSSLQSRSSWGIGTGIGYGSWGEPYVHSYPVYRDPYRYRHGRTRFSREIHELRRAEFRERFEARSRQFDEEYGRGAFDEGFFAPQP